MTEGAGLARGAFTVGGCVNVLHGSTSKEAHANKARPVCKKMFRFINSAGQVEFGRYADVSLPDRRRGLITAPLKPGTGKIWVG